MAVWKYKIDSLLPGEDILRGSELNQAEERLRVASSKGRDLNQEIEVRVHDDRTF